MNVFVTGGSRGIGRAIVLQAIRLGHDVVFTYLSNREAAEGVIEEARGIDSTRRCITYQLDVGDSEKVDAVGDQAVSDLDGMDVVINNAGVCLNGLAASQTDEEWSAVIQTNLTGAFFVCRQFLPTFLAARAGRFISVSSVGAAGATGQAAYAASKAGLIGLSAALAKEYGPRGITSNVALLGYFDTDMTRSHMSSANHDFWTSYCPARRAGSPEEAASAVLFLGSEEASFINGETLSITGGLGWAP